MRKLPLIILALAVLIELIWVIFSRIYLNSGHFKQSLQSPHVKTEFSSIRSWVPGILNIKDLKISGDESKLVWFVSFQSTTGFINLLSLLRKDVNVLWAQMEHGKLRFKSTKGLDSEDSAGESDESDDKHGQDKEDDPSGRDGEQLKWSFHFRNLDFKHIEELTIGQLLLKGDSKVSGDFFITKSAMMTMPEAEITIIRAEATLDQQLFGEIKPSRLAVSFADYSPQIDASEDLVRKSKLDIDFAARLVDPKPLLAMFSKLKWLRVKSSAVETKARIVTDGSRMIEPTSILLNSSEFSLGFAKQTASGKGHILLKVQKDTQAKPETYSEFVLDDYTLKGDHQTQNDIEGKALKLTISSPDIDIFSPFKVWSLNLELPPAHIKTLSFANAYIPRGMGFSLISGAGAFSTQIQAHSGKQQPGGGHMYFDAKNAGFRYHKSTILADIKADLIFDRIDLDEGLFHMKTSMIGLSNVSTETLFAKGEAHKTSGWFGKLSLEDMTVKIEAPESFDGQVQLNAKDISPLLALYMSQKPFPGWIMEGLNMQNPKLSFHVQANQQRMLLSNIVASSEKLNLKAWFDRQGNSPTGRILLNYGKLKAGIGIKDDDYEIKLMGADAWYQGAQPTFP